MKGNQKENKVKKKLITNAGNKNDKRVIKH